MTFEFLFEMANPFLTWISPIFHSLTDISCLKFDHSTVMTSSCIWFNPLISVTNSLIYELVKSIIKYRDHHMLSLAITLIIKT